MNVLRAVCDRIDHASTDSWAAFLVAVVLVVMVLDARARRA